MARMLIDAIRNGDIQTARDMILTGSYGCIDSQTSWRDGTALFLCCSHGYLDLVRLLLDRGACLTSTDQNGATPLHGAADNGHIDIAKLLLEHGADVNVQTWNGDTALHLSAYRGFLELTQCLVEKGADCTVQNGKNLTAHEEAFSQGHDSLGRYLQIVQEVLFQGDRPQRQPHGSRTTMIELDPPIEAQLIHSNLHPQKDQLQVEQLKQQHYQHRAQKSQQEPKHHHHQQHPQQKLPTKLAVANSDHCQILPKSSETLISVSDLNSLPSASFIRLEPPVDLNDTPDMFTANNLKSSDLLSSNHSLGPKATADAHANSNHCNAHVSSSLQIDTSRKSRVPVEDVDDGADLELVQLVKPVMPDVLVNNVSASYNTHARAPALSPCCLSPAATVSSHPHLPLSPSLSPATAPLAKFEIDADARLAVPHRRMSVCSDSSSRSGHGCESGLPSSQGRRSLSSSGSDFSTGPSDDPRDLRALYADRGRISSRNSSSGSSPCCCEMSSDGCGHMQNHHHERNYLRMDGYGRRSTPSSGVPSPTPSSEFSDIYDSSLYSLGSLNSGPPSSWHSLSSSNTSSGTSSMSMDSLDSESRRNWSQVQGASGGRCADGRPRLDRATSVRVQPRPGPDVRTMLNSRPSFKKSISVCDSAHHDKLVPAGKNITSLNDLSSSKPSSSSSSSSTSSSTSMQFNIPVKTQAPMTSINIPFS